MPLDAQSSDLSRAEGRLQQLLTGAYEGVDGVDRLVLLARESGLPTASVNLNRALDLVLANLLTVAAQGGKFHDFVTTAAARNNAIHDELLQLLRLLEPGIKTASASTRSRPLDTVLAALDEVECSRSPVVIAVESTDEPLEDADLLRTERHLLVSLNRTQLEAIRRITADVVRPAERHLTGVDDLIDIGVEIWTELVVAEPRLKGLLERIADAGLSQPVAWCGRRALLEQLQVAVLVAHTGDATAEGFVSVGGGHYFMPTDVGRHCTIRPRSPDAPPVARELDLRTAPDDRPRDPVLSDIVVVLGGDDVATALRELAQRPPSDPKHPTRAVLGLGAGIPDADLIATVLERIPLLSSTPAAMARPDVVRVLKRAMTRHAPDRAMPCIVAAVRAACIRDAVTSGDSQALVEALTWSTWSLIGLPLFPTGYDELLPAAYPHLMDLRTVSAEGWYFNRREGIPDDYSAEMLSQEVPAERLFHLYLSGAGGTGKSCFLRYIADRMASRRSTIPIWYRVDAPSSSWKNIEDRLQEETIAAIERSPFGAEPAAELAQLPGRPTLGVFLNETVSKLRAIDPDFDEIVVFIDQLERTFESGDEPDPARLDMISQDVAQLLRTVGIGKGIRVFIASRKQYLPDFLRSSRTARTANLEFNVLQSIEDALERLAFVQLVIDWCKNEQLVASHLMLSQGAKAMLAERAQGHPLNMMLSLIQLLSARPGGDISADDLGQLRPWENLFAIDLKAAERDDLDWHFLLAMAHARTEIVRFEEVWWRLRMVDQQLTRRVEELTPEGILERLWLLGFLGRTLHVRPYAGNPARFVEFFHANLRDYLLRNVMARSGSDVDVRRRRTGTPPAWRALDRLAGYARDWEQTQQLLPADDVRVLMEHRDKVIEQVTPPGAEPTPRFQLLFLRESHDEGRAALRQAATECFAFSALVHDDRGRDTFGQLFPDVDVRVDRCEAWLARCSADGRPALLAYLVETQTPKAWTLLTGLVLDGRGAVAEATAQEIAALLSEPLYAGDFRNQIVARLLREGLDRARGALDSLPTQLVAFVVTACGGERDALVRVLEYGVESLKSDAEPAVRDLATRLGASDVIERWLGDAPTAARYSGPRTVERAELPAGAVLGLAIGKALRTVADEARLSDWSGQLRSRLGVPVPALRTLTGECADEELELRSSRGRLATNLFRAGQVCVDGRRWDEFARTAPNTVLDSYDLPSGQTVMWLPADTVERAGYPFPARTLDEAAVDWLETHCRRTFDLLMDDELFGRITHDWAVSSVARSRVATSPEWRGLLRRVIIDLVEEGVPLGAPDGPTPAALVEQVAWLAGGPRPENLTQKVREFLQPWICQAVADEFGQVTTLLLDEQLEQSLVDSVFVQAGRRLLRLRPRDASRLHAAVRRAIERLLAESGRPPIVLVTDPVLRYALARLLWKFGTRYPVLSYSELDLDVLITVPGGLISPAGNPDAR